MRHLTLAALTAATLAAGAPAFAQTLDQITVTGHGPQAMSISDTVSFADLNLTQQSDRDRLERRVNDTAGRVCERLNQDPATHHNIGKSCEDVAVRDAMGQVRQAFADAASSPAYVNRFGAPASATVPATPDPDPASFTVSTVDNGPIPDTPQNRARYGGPTSRAGRHTAARGN